MSFIRKFVLIVASAATLLGPASVLADQFDDQISVLRAQAAQQQAVASQYAAQASDYQAKVDQLTAQINAVQAQIDLNQARSDQVSAEITDNETKLAEAKTVLAANLKSMYLASSVTPLEMIASSNNLSDYFNSQQYQDSIKDKIQQVMASILTLQTQLATQKQQLTDLLNSLKVQEDGIAASKAQMDQLLALASQNAAAANQQVRSSNAQISSLRSAQAASFARFSGATSGSGSITFKNLSFGGSCGGGYPSSLCSYDTDALVDQWGLYSRECVSYAAWAMTDRGGSVPNFSGQGNATEWPGYLGNRGYRVDTDPSGSRVVAIATASVIGGVGHAMVVENGGAITNGYIHVSQYNWWPTENGPYGLYSTMDVKPAGLLFIHF